jgi:hypothetical protein
MLKKNEQTYKEKLESILESSPPIPLNQATELF